MMMIKSVDGPQRDLHQDPTALAPPLLPPVLLHQEVLHEEVLPHAIMIVHILSPGLIVLVLVLGLVINIAMVTSTVVGVNDLVIRKDETMVEMRRRSISVNDATARIRGTGKDGEGRRRKKKKKKEGTRKRKKKGAAS